MLVQLCARKYDFEWAVNRRAVEGLGGIAIDGVIICAIGTLSLGAIGANVGPLIILAAAVISWSVFATLVIGPRIFRQHWFEHSIPEFGESQGMLACGFVMLDMVDPSRQTDVVRGYSYRQIITRPILGDWVASLHRCNYGGGRGIGRMGNKADAQAGVAKPAIFRKSNICGFDGF